MRRFRDRAGNGWDVVVGRESWGTSVALFVPDRSTDPVRQVVLRAASPEAAAQELDAFDADALQQLLDQSTIKDEERT